MKISIKKPSSLYVIIAFTVAISSCNKDNSADTGATATANNSIATNTIAVAASSASASTDSIYIIQPCARGEIRDSIEASALPASIATYLTANYTGYTITKAYAIKNSAGTIIAYVAIIYYNDKPVGVLFNSSGNFVKVLEQRDKGDLDGRGWHFGGRFEDRGGIKKDTVALSMLPSVITSYYSGNYPSDTLLKAFTNRDSSYLVLSKDNGLFASVFTAGGAFVKRVELPSKRAIYIIKEITGLAGKITAYLDAAYPNYTLKNAYSVWLNGTVKAYIVIVDANNSRYALEFDSAGNFVLVRTLF